MGVLTMATTGDADLARRLMIKYGLPDYPNDASIRLWRVRTNQYIVEGNDGETAGRKAASDTFAGFDTRIYRSEADDIVSLLDAARNR
jgi:hypothetical protein